MPKGRSYLFANHMCSKESVLCDENTPVVKVNLAVGKPMDIVAILTNKSSMYINKMLASRRHLAMLHCKRIRRVHCASTGSKGLTPMFRYTETTPLESAGFRLFAYQSAENGTRLFDIDDRMAKLGLWEVTLPEACAPYANAQSHLALPDLW